MLARDAGSSQPSLTGLSISRPDHPAVLPGYSQPSLTALLSLNNLPRAVTIVIETLKMTLDLGKDAEHFGLS
jgi:hypothetical protein